MTKSSRSFDLPFNRFLLITVIPMLVVMVLSVIVAMWFDDKVEKHTSLITSDAIYKVIDAQRSAVNLEILRSSLHTLATTTVPEQARRAYVDAWGLLSDSSLDHHGTTKNAMYSLMRTVRFVWRERESTDHLRLEIDKGWHQLHHDVFALGSLTHGIHSEAMQTLHHILEEPSLRPMTDAERISHLDKVEQQIGLLCALRPHKTSETSTDNLEHRCQSTRQQTTTLRNSLHRLVNLHKQFQSQLSVLEQHATNLRRAYAEVETSQLFTDIRGIKSLADKTKPLFYLIFGIAALMTIFMMVHFFMVIKPLRAVMSGMRTFLRDNRLPSTPPHSLIREINLVTEWLMHFCEMTYQERLKASHVAFEFDSLLKEAHIDPLTGVANRRSLEAVIAKHVDVQPNTALMMLDLDHFKVINDTKGHPFGDQILRAVGKVLLDTVSDTDLVYRYGGEEFVIVLPDVTEGTLLAMANRIRENIQNISRSTAKLSNHRAETPLTVSIGLSSITEHKGEKDLVRLIREADLALYEAKNIGRNTFKQYHEDIGAKRSNERQATSVP